MVTLAHYIRNAIAVIGGFSAQLEKRLTEPDLREKLALILRAAREIEAVIDSLESLRDLDRTQYIASWETRMIDLSKELTARLKSTGEGKSHHDK